MGRPHITSDRIRNFNAAIFGAGKYVVDTGSKFSYEIISNNQIKINDGQLISQGTHACIDLNNYEELQIDTGLQGLKRNDLIVARYTRNKITDVESMQMVVIKGTSSEDAEDPPYITGDVLSGASEDDMPLYRVRLDGLNIESVECMFTVMPSLPAVNAKAEQNAKSNYGVPLHFKAHGNNAVAFAHIPQNKTNVKIIQCVYYGIADYVNDCTISYDATKGFVSVICTNTAIIDKLAYATFIWD